MLKARLHKRHLWMVLLGLTAAFLLIVAVAYTYGKHRLNMARLYVEQQYSPQIDYLEDAMKRLSHDDLIDLKLLHAEEFVKPLRLDEVFAIGWSYDGHHGARSVVPMPCGYSISSWVTSTDSSGNRTLHFGQSFDGDALLVLVGWVPDAIEMKQYTIAFYRTEIEGDLGGVTE